MEKNICPYGDRTAWTLHGDVSIKAGSKGFVWHYRRCRLSREYRLDRFCPLRRNDKEPYPGWGLRVDPTPDLARGPHKLAFWAPAALLFLWPFGLAHVEVVAHGSVPPYQEFNTQYRKMGMGNGWVAVTLKAGHLLNRRLAAWSLTV